MPTPAEIYIDGVKRKLKNYYAAWLPNEKLKLGDIGILDGNLFTRLTSLADLGIAFAERKDPDSTPIDYVSESGVSIFLKAIGEVNPNLPNVPETKAGLSVEFSQEGAFIFKAPQSYEPSIENIVQLEQHVRQAFQDGRWIPNWAIIVRLVQTPTATIIVSTSSQSKMEFAVEGDISTGGIDFSNGALNFGLKFRRGDVLTFIRAENLTPIFQVARLKKRWFRNPTFSIRSMRSGLAGTESLTPAEAKADPTLMDSLYLDLILDDDLK
jgi:hypothetical protein